MPSNALQITDPESDNPLAQAPSIDPRQFGAETEAEMSPLELWLAQQRAKNNARGYEPLPGITSGVPPKPWGLNRDQPLYQRPAYQSGFVQTLQRIRPIDQNVDPGISLGDAQIPGTRSGTPVIMQQRPNWKYRET